MLLYFIFLVFLNSIYTLEDGENIRKSNFGYLFTFPKIIHSGKNETMCLVVSNANTKPSKVLVDLKIKENHYTTATTFESEHTCFKIYIPEQKLAEARIANLNLQIQVNGTIVTASNWDPIFVYPDSDILFLETDKGMYKPGSVVNIRILKMTSDLKIPKDKVIPFVKVINPTGQIVAYWENIETEMGLVQVEHLLTDETTLGKWKIETKGTSKIFLVSRYNLPRFKINFTYPKRIYSKSDNFFLLACAKYLYGKKVQGTAFIKISNPALLRHPITKAEKLVDGCAQWNITSNEIPFKNGHSLIVTATVAEKETFQSENRNGKIYITDKPFILDFSISNPYFQPGLPYHGKLKITNKLISTSGEIVEICYNVAVKRIWNIKKTQQCSNFTIADDYDLNFYIPPLKEKIAELQLQAKTYFSSKLEKQSATFIVKRWFSPSFSYIHIEKTSDLIAKCKSAQQFTVYFTSQHMVMNETIYLYYMIRSQNEIIKLRKIPHRVYIQNIEYYDEFRNIVGKPDKYTTTRPTEKLTIKFKLDPKIISNAQIIVYYITKLGEVVAANKDIKIEECLHNQVDTNWKETQLYPGELANLKIKTEPDSLCGIAVIDKAATLLANPSFLTPGTVLQPLLPENIKKGSYIHQCIRKKQKYKPGNIEESPLELRRKKRLIGFEDFDNYGSYDSHDVFSESGIATITNMKLINKICQPQLHRGGFDEVSVLSIPNSLKTVEYESGDEDRGISIRSVFPETWLWDLVHIGKTGVSSIKRYLPHTITNWVSNVLCISPKSGLGISVPEELSVSQQFFIDLLIPYSIKRGEILNIQVVVFNYFSYSLPVSLMLGETDGIELLDNNDQRKIVFCVGPADSSSYSYKVKGTKIGRRNITVLSEIESSYPGKCGPDTLLNKRDVVYKPIIIESEGYPNEITKSTILCANDSKTANNITWKFEKPHDIVADSEQLKVLINPDLLGPVIQNLEKLLTVPTGCGEQIMSKLAPNLYVLRYLKSINKITDSISQRAIRNIKIGYQRILAYIHKDGSFSAFGRYDNGGSMFLTVYVVKILQQAKKYIYVDELVINKAVKWISEHQLENGCFPALSHVFQDMGEINYENSTAALTSYVIISLLENKISISENLKLNAKFCICANSQPDKYTLALSTYALFLLNWKSEADQRLQKLIDISTKDANLMWWRASGSKPLNVETTAYALNALLYKNTMENLAHASAIVRWLATQQNSRGAFVTTQDSAVALDSLSRYASMVIPNSPNLKVEISSTSYNHNIDIQPMNYFKNEEITIKNNLESIKIKTEGSGCIIAQVFYTFNVVHLENSEAFKLAIDANPVSTIDKCSITTVTPCVSYAGPGLHSNMAVLEVELPSGYEPDRASLYELLELQNKRVKRFEEEPNKVSLYFTELNNEPVCLPFKINENFILDNHVEANVKLYDYYKPEMKVSKSYTLKDCVHHQEKTNSTNLGTLFTFDNDTIDVNNKIIAKRSTYQLNNDKLNGLNEKFVDMDMEMDVPSGIEGNIAMYMMPDNTTSYTKKLKLPTF